MLARSCFASQRAAVLDMSEDLSVGNPALTFGSTSNWFIALPSVWAAALNRGTDGDRTAGFIQWKSESIMRRLVDKYSPGKLLPGTPEGGANANRWMNWQISSMNLSIVPLFVALIRTLEEKRDPNVTKTATEKASNARQIIGSQLAHRGYLACDIFSLGHIPLGVWAHPWLRLPIERSELTYVSGWYQRLSERPSYRRHVVISVT